MQDHLKIELGTINAFDYHSQEIVLYPFSESLSCQEGQLLPVDKGKKKATTLRSTAVTETKVVDKTSVLSKRSWDDSNLAPKFICNENCHKKIKYLQLELAQARDAFEDVVKAYRIIVQRFQYADTVNEKVSAKNAACDELQKIITRRRKYPAIRNTLKDTKSMVAGICCNISKLC